MPHLQRRSPRLRRTLALLLAVTGTARFAPAQTPTPSPTTAPSADVLASVDPRIGVLAAGSCVIGPTLPFGSIHPSPTTPDGGYDGYHPDRPIRGFAQTHVSGTGWGTYGNVLVSPQVGLNTAYGTYDSPKADEKAEPHQYTVRLAKYDVKAELTPAHRAAFYRFTFPATDQAHLVIDATQHIPGDIATGQMKYAKKPVPASVQLAPDGRSVSGKATYPAGFGGPYTVYFYAEFDQTPTSFGTFRDTDAARGQTSPGQTAIESSGQLEHLGVYVRFNTAPGKPVLMKVAVSFLSVEKAKQSLAQDLPDWNYDAARDAAAAAWRTALSAIDVTGGTDAQRTLFYTALYHCQIMPRLRTGEFARFAPDVPMYDDHYAIWDTWRTLYPLFALIRPDVVRDSVASFVERHRVDGPVYDTLIAGYNKPGEQGGNGTDMVIGDALAKSVPGIDREKAYAVLKYHADHARAGRPTTNPADRDAYREQGWIPSGIMSTSITQEYALNDHVAAVAAASLGHTADAEKYHARSTQWVNLWNPDAASDGFKGFIMPRNADGTWPEWDPKTYGGSWKPYFYEASSWTYSFFAPHQNEKLVELMGGPKAFTDRLVHAFDKRLLKLDNEPAFLIPQLFHYVGRPDLAALHLNNHVNKSFTLKGYPGDDDSGAMSSYYVWARIGLFPNAGTDLYYLTGPAFDRITLTRPGQPPLTLTRSGPGIYIQSISLNDKPLPRTWLRHAELAGDAHLHFTMGDTPTTYGAENPPPALWPPAK